MNIHVAYAVRNIIFDVKIHVKIVRLFIILREFSTKVPASSTFYLKIHVKITQLFTISRKFKNVLNVFGILCETIIYVRSLYICILDKSFRMSQWQLGTQLHSA